jgi:hypothetical protein
MLKNIMTKISYGKNVYGKKEIKAVLKTLKNSTQMGKSVEAFEYQIQKLFARNKSNNLFLSIDKFL